MLLGMTEKPVVASVKLPARLKERKPLDRKPTTRRGRKLARLLEAGKAERGPEMTLAEVEREIRERRGRNF